MAERYMVHIREVKDYYLLVEAEHAKHAEALAYDHGNFVKGMSDELETEVIEVAKESDYLNTGTETSLKGRLANFVHKFLK